MRTSSLVRRCSLPLVPVVAAVGLAACSPDPQGGAGDAPIAAVEQEPWTVLNNVDEAPGMHAGSLGITTSVSLLSSAERVT